MSYIQEVINWLDNRRERANIDDVANITTQFVPKTGKSFYRDTGDDYLFALKENYETLKQAALAGEELSKAIEKMDEVDWNDRTPRDKFEARKYVNELWRSKRNAALTEYLNKIGGRKV